jgi:hypothetical protein
MCLRNLLMPENVRWGIEIGVDVNGCELIAVAAVCFLLFVISVLLMLEEDLPSC